MADETIIIALNEQGRIIARADSEQDLRRMLAERGHNGHTDIRWVDAAQMLALSSNQPDVTTPPASAARRASRKRLADVNPPLDDKTPIQGEISQS